MVNKDSLVVELATGALMFSVGGTGTGLINALFFDGSFLQGFGLGGTGAFVAYFVFGVITPMLRRS